MVATRQADTDLVTRRARRPTRLTRDETDWLARAGSDVHAVLQCQDHVGRDQEQILLAS
jgi:hypothetical protein